MNNAVPKCVRVTVTAEYADGSRAEIEATDLHELEILHAAVEPGEDLVLRSPSIGNASVTVRIVPAAEPVRYREIPARAEQPLSERTKMWRDLVSDKGIDVANREWPKLDPERGGPGYHSE